MTSKFQKLLMKSGIDERFNKRIQKPKHFTAIRSNVNLQEDYNFMADLLILPTTKFGYHMLFVIMDLATNEFDIEPIKSKEPFVILNAMRNCFKREYVRKPYASITTDAGSEFKSVFNKWCYDESILHKVTLPGRHTQMSAVDGLIKQISRMINGYMNETEKLTGKRSVNWLPVLPAVREDLNEYRKTKIPKNINSYEYPIHNPTKEIFDKNSSLKSERTYELIKPKFKEGDMVHRALDIPQDALGKQQSTHKFRAGDFTFERTPRKILKVFYYSGKVLYRYYLEGLPNVSFVENQLMKV